MTKAKHTNFQLSLKRLQSFVKQGVIDDMDKAGLIQAFEFTYEQSWKTIQKIAGGEFVTIASPKTAFSWAIEKGWILQEDEQLWLEIMKARNLTSHTYNVDLANQVCSDISNRYVQAFDKLLSQMVQHSS